MLLQMLGSLLLCTILVPLAESSPRPCPCTDKSLCSTITGPPVNPNGELYGFSASWVDNQQDLNWTYITTVAWASDDEVMCRAHQHGARAVIGAPQTDLDALVEPSARKEWIEVALQQVQDTYRDGLVFDYESPQEVGSIGGETYAALIAETRDAFHSANPSLQVSTCVAWSPDNIDGRGYPYDELADASDLLYVMDYDTRSQIYDSQCIAGSNAPFPGMVLGLQRYFGIGINPNKLILGVPWYGYRYQCLSGTSSDAVYCPIKQVPFRGVNCSDAAGSEVGYAVIMSRLRDSDIALTGGLRRDSNTGDPYFNSIETDANGISAVYQYWFDDPSSLRAKYAWARKNGLGGIGPFVFNNLDPIGAKEDASEMWGALDSFFIDSQNEILLAETIS